MSRLFLSYRRSDSPGTVKNIQDQLMTRLPRWTLFYDHNNLEPGEDFPRRLNEEVTSSRVVLIVIGPRWAEMLKLRLGKSGVDHVREEVRLALQAGHTVIPVLVENAVMPGESDLADFPELMPLLRLNGRSIRPDPDFDTDLERLAGYLDELGPGIGTGTVLAGKYKILREIGHGGMGIVYEAEQGQPHRRVAVKMILEGMDTKEVLARFDGEKEALARMDHPNIARVIDSGSSPAGKPYFVMEFVKGEPINAYADRKKLPPVDRLGLIRQVCSAVQHAHQKGIIHRDIKPSNVLVEEIDGRAVPKVIDFGLAKALAGRLTNKTLLSEHGKTVGTLIYSSPEQAAGRIFEIDTRTDVYSLGVLMYELLAGAPPFTEDELRQIGDDAMRQEIIDKEPSKPSTKLSSSNALPSIAANRQLEPRKLTRLVRGELDWIAMRALEKDPKRRYETANELSDDIERYLNHEPVKAGRPSTLYRLKKFVRRNRVPVAAAGLVIAAIVCGLIAVNIEQRKTATALTERQTALAEVETQKNRVIANAALAGKRFDEKRDALDEMLKTFSDANLRGRPGSQPIRKLFLERGIEQYRTMLADRSGDPSVSLRTTEALRELGSVTKELGNTTESLEHLGQAVRVGRASVAANPADRRLVASLGDALYEQAQALFEQNRYAEAKPSADESVAIFESLSSKFPEEVDYRAKWGRGLVRRASLRPEGQSPASDYEQALKLLRAAVDAKPDQPDTLLSLARAVNNEANFRLGDKPEAIEAFKQAVELTNRAIRNSPAIPLGNALRATFVRNVCHRLRANNRATEAIAYLDAQLPTMRLVIAENPAVVDGPVFLATLLDERALILENLNRTEDAVLTYEEIAQINEGLAQRDPANDKYALKTIDANDSIARLYKSKNRDPEAIRILEYHGARSDQIMRLRPTSDSLLAELLRLEEKLGRFHLEAEQYDDARRVCHRAIDLYDRYQSNLRNRSELTTYRYLTCCDGLVNVAKAQKNTTLAIEILEKRIQPIDADIFRKVDYQERLLSSLSTLGTLYAESGRLEKSLKLRSDLVDRATKLLKGDPSSNFYLYNIVLQSQRELATLSHKLGDARATYEALRRYFAETDPYVSESDHSQLLAETSEFKPDNVAKLWEQFERTTELRGMKRFTVPVNFNGIKEPYSIYVADSWRYLEDQIKWIENVRDGKFPTEVKDSFQRLYKIAKEHKISFQEVCAYSLGPVSNNAETVPLFEKAARQKDLVSNHPRDTEQRLQLAEDDLALAVALEQCEDLSRPISFLDDVRRELEHCLADGAREEGRIARIRAAESFSRGKVYARQDRPDAAYQEFLATLRAVQNPDISSAVAMKDLCLELGRSSQVKKRLIEASIWYTRSAEAGSPDGLDALLILIEKDASVVSMLPMAVRELLKQGAAPGEKPHQSLARLWPQYSSMVDQTKKLEKEAKSKQTAKADSPRPKSDFEKDFDKLFEDQFGIILLQGRNTRGVRIYCYLKCSISEFKRLNQVLKGNQEFTIPDYGTVIAAGKGKPPEEVKKLIKIAFPSKDIEPLVIQNEGNSSLALGPWEKLLESDPGDLPGLLILRATGFARQGRVDEVVRSAAKLREVGIMNKGTLYDAACAYSLAAGQVAKGKAEATRAEADERKKYQILAITCLKEAIAAGYSDFEDMAQDEDLIPLRDLADYKTLYQKP